MARIREIKKIAGIWTIKLTPIDAKDYGLVEGDKVDIEDLEMLQNKDKKRKK